MPNSFEDTSVIRNIKNNKNTTLIRELKNGAFNNVLISRAIKYTKEHSECYYIPFGMEFKENIDITKHQVKNIPKEVKRIVVPVGSGMSFCSIATGLIENNMTNIELVGIQVGKDPMGVINKYLGFYLSPLMKNNYNLNYKIIKSKHHYEKEINVKIEDLELDPIYEAKCFEYLKENDLLWIVGKRKGE